MSTTQSKASNRTTVTENLNTYSQFSLGLLTVFPLTVLRSAMLTCSVLITAAHAYSLVSPRDFFSQSRLVNTGPHGKLSTGAQTDRNRPFWSAVLRLSVYENFQSTGVGRLLGLWGTRTRSFIQISRFPQIASLSTVP